MGITGPVEETQPIEMRRAFETNFFGAIEVMKAVLPQMRKQKQGLIINVTSIAGYMGLPFQRDLFDYQRGTGDCDRILEHGGKAIQYQGNQYCSW